MKVKVTWQMIKAVTNLEVICLSEFTILRSVAANATG